MKQVVCSHPFISPIVAGALNTLETGSLPIYDGDSLTDIAARKICEAYARFDDIPLEPPLAPLRDPKRYIDTTPTPRAVTPQPNGSVTIIKPTGSDVCTGSRVECATRL